MADLTDVLDRVTGAGADLTDGQQQTPPGRQLVPLAGGGQMSRRRQLFAAITQGCRQARRNWEAAKKRPGPIHWFENWKPESVAELSAYGDSKTWVPAGHEGGTADTVGTFYYSIVAPWLVRFLIFGLWVVQRFFRFCVAAGLLLLAGGVTAGLLLH